MDSTTIQTLKESVRGAVLCPGDADYEQTRILHNAMIDKQPAAIVRCTGVADVRQCVNVAREHSILTSIRGGGHGVAGNALCDGGLMIDLSLLRNVRVDAEKRIAWISGGATLGEIDHETQVFGLVAPAGVVSETGIAGLALGGGFGWVRGKYGMSVDNMLSVDIVTADGELRHASADENPDLFWAVRGGGGNFGVVTTFEFQLHPLGPIVMHCAPIYAGSQARDILRGWREFMQTAPDDFTSEFFFWTVPDHESFPPDLRGLDIVIPAGVYAGPSEEGERYVQPLRELGTPLLDLSAQRPFTAVQQMFDVYLPKGEMLNYWKSLYLDGMTDDVIDRLVEVFNERPARRTPFVLHDLRGASSRIDADATAFGARDMPYLMEFNSSWQGPQDTDANIDWTRKVWNDMAARFSNGGGYLNMTSYNDDGEGLVKDTYGVNYARLRQVKARYDPDNLFRLNANILPA